LLIDTSTDTQQQPFSVISWHMASSVEVKLPDPAIVGLLDRDGVAVDVDLLANARKMPESADDVAANRGDVLIFPL
jgi:hypothetical protein